MKKTIFIFLMFALTCFTFDAGAGPPVINQADDICHVQPEAADVVIAPIVYGSQKYVYFSDQSYQSFGVFEPVTNTKRFDYVINRSWQSKKNSYNSTLITRSTNKQNRLPLIRRF